MESGPSGVPPERPRIVGHTFVDRITALLTFDDGRHLRVQLIASFDPSADAAVPTVQVELADGRPVQLAPEELRRVAAAPPRATP